MWGGLWWPKIDREAPHQIGLVGKEVSVLSTPLATSSRKPRLGGEVDQFRAEHEGIEIFARFLEASHGHGQPWHVAGELRRHRFALLLGDALGRQADDDAPRHMDQLAIQAAGLLATGALSGKEA